MKNKSFTPYPTFLLLRMKMADSILGILQKHYVYIRENIFLFTFFFQRKWDENLDCSTTCFLDFN